jgi:hypothetical protein
MPMLAKGPRMASLVDVFTAEEFKLSHGPNLIGRFSTKHSDATKLPLRISENEGTISRHQATVLVANHKTGVRITLTTNRDAKNATKLRSAERFGSKRSHISLKSGEAVTMKPGDIIELGKL